ncbi:hypothetical protein FSPOR_11006 [Fusarium sporotrichioides]|uniref:Uncharacterized protein n=1 Tax=Fusarium sporotrichioides TaxID=5514 RepID=A0A395RIH4_FUSSP|nr:hypothetical protein FSPOR_11006 [Fusarium sporotrichioides]
MPLNFPNVDRDLDKQNNRTFMATGLSSGYTVIGVTTIDTTLGWDTVTDSETQSTSDMSTSDEPLTVTKTVLSPPGNQPEEKTEIISNIIMSTITHEFTSTVTIDPSVGLEPPSTVWITSLNPPTFVPPPPPPTTSTAAPSSKSILSTVELVGVIFGTICLLLIICLPVLYAIWRRRRTSAPSDSQNNITIRIGNGECSRWSHSDDSRPTPIPASEHSQENVIRTEVIKRPIGTVSPPPRYNDYWKGENEEYEMGVRETVAEASGSKLFEHQQYSDPKGKGKAREDNWI